MGSLADLRLPTAEIAIPGPEGTSFRVRGLSVADCTSLLRQHGEALNSVYTETVSVGGDAVSFSATVQALMTSAPLAVAQIIALAADEPDSVDKVVLLPFPTQVEALTRIAALTFESEEQLGNLLETVIAGSQTIRRIVEKMTAEATPPPHLQA